MGYNSEEEKKLAESIAQKTEAARELFGDKKVQKTLMESLEKILPAVNQLHEKSKYEPLTAEELELLNSIQPALELLKQTMDDAQLLLGNSLLVAANAQFFHYKKLAEEGNEDARKAYERLLPGFKKAMGPSIDGPLGLN
ncbi:MAG: hypothetical protein K9G46_06805 [Flavobacteriales bacterium]|jgi:phosphoglycolate phosphatase-like HAD superfamily hydrolase|nr:hypothetical protein [Flavobacteriales bacterium]